MQSEQTRERERERPWCDPADINKMAAVERLLAGRRRRPPTHKHTRSQSVTSIVCHINESVTSISQHCLTSSLTAAFCDSSVFTPTKRYSTSCCCYSTSWAHHVCLEATSLAASAKAYCWPFWFTSCWTADLRSTWQTSLPAYHHHRPATTPIVQSCYVWGSTNKSEWTSCIYVILNRLSWSSAGC